MKKEFKIGDLVYITLYKNKIKKIVRMTKTMIFTNDYDLINNKIIDNIENRYRKDGTGFNDSWVINRLYHLTEDVKNEYFNEYYRNKIISILEGKSLEIDVLKKIWEMIK